MDKTLFYIKMEHCETRSRSYNIHDTVMYISYYENVLSLKMDFIAESCCWWLLIDKVVFRLNLHLFYLQYIETERESLA
jgi:hypothetical protein